MKQHSMVLTLLHKDLRLFWPFAALVALLHISWQFPPLVAQLGQVAGLIQMGLQLGSELLVLVVCYEDAVVSLKHDWLTRPIPGPKLLLAKFLFVALAVNLPIALGAAAYNLSRGGSLGEAALVGVSSGARGDIVGVMLVVMAFAAITTSLRQAVIVFLAGLAAVAVITVGVSALRDIPESPVASSSGWVLDRSLMLLLMAAAVAILWVQYRHRHTRTARVIAVAAIIGGTALVSLVTWKPVFAIQKMLTSDAGASASVQLAMAEGCFPARILDAGSGASSDAVARLTAQRYSEEHRKAAGPDAIAFSTHLLGQQLPAGELLAVSHVVLSYFSAGEELRRLRPGLTSSQRMTPREGRPTAEHYWLLSDAEAKRLASTAGVETRLDYSLSLLAPKRSAQFVADGRRSYYPDIGFCGASFDRAAGTVTVNCFKPGAQPAMLTASLDGVADPVVSNHRIDFTPAVLDFWGGYRHEMRLVARDAQAPRVNVTAYEARAHFDRQIVVPGVLGGPVTACPAP